LVQLHLDRIAQVNPALNAVVELLAARALADAFTIPDAHSTDADRARDRGRMGELFERAKGSQSGLGDLVLGAYDRNVALLHARELRLRQSDPNAQLTDPLLFTLTATDGRKFAMAELKGKVVVLDFWATWCGPCRAQHPLYTQASERFHDHPGVVFLSIDADDDHSLVKPFLDEEKWPGPVYFEDGLTRALEVFAFPTTIVLDKRGQVFSRLNGFVPERYVETLTGRVRLLDVPRGAGPVLEVSTPDGVRMVLRLPAGSSLDLASLMTAVLGCRG